MTIKLAYTKNGPLLADVTENLDGTYTAENPVIIQPQPQNIAMFPLLGMCEEKSITLTKEDINFGQLFTPVLDLANAYRSQFGSGLQLVTSH